MTYDYIVDALQLNEKYSTHVWVIYNRPLFIQVWLLYLTLFEIIPETEVTRRKSYPGESVFIRILIEYITEFSKSLSRHN